MDSLIQVQDLVKVYSLGEVEVDALRRGFPFGRSR